MDRSEVYLQIEVDAECSELLTLNTHRRIFNLIWLGFGIKVTASIFQQVMDTMLSGQDDVVFYLDDILPKIKNTEDHKKNAFEIFRKIKDYG